MQIIQKQKKPRKLLVYKAFAFVGPSLALSLAVRRGLEPLTPCVTGTYSNQLN